MMEGSGANVPDFSGVGDDVVASHFALVCQSIKLFVLHLSSIQKASHGGSVSYDGMSLLMIHLVL